MHLIVGLGNPGKEYSGTRHNVGFAAVEKAMENFGFAPAKLISKFKSLISAGAINGKKIVFAEPQTFMNESGAAVRQIADFYKIKPADITIIHDDKDIPLGDYRLQKNRGPAGHNGIKSVIERLGTKDFSRFRIGIKPARDINDTAAFVLTRFTRTEQKMIDDVIKKITEQISAL